MSELQKAAMECKDVQYTNGAGETGSLGKDIVKNINAIDSMVRWMKWDNSKWSAVANFVTRTPTADTDMFQGVMESNAAQLRKEMHDIEGSSSLEIQDKLYKACDTIAKKTEEAAGLKDAKGMIRFMKVTAQETEVMKVAAAKPAADAQRSAENSEIALRKSLGFDAKGHVPGQKVH